MTSLERGSKAEIAAIKETFRQFAATINAGDLEGWMTLWTEDGIQMFPGAPSRIGKGQIRAGMKPAFDEFVLKMVINNEELRAFGDLGFARGTYKESGVPKAGGETWTYDGKYLTIFERQADGSWRVARDIFNSNGPET